MTDESRKHLLERLKQYADEYNLAESLLREVTWLGARAAREQAA